MTSIKSVSLSAKRRARQAGLTLAETLLVLAIGALAIVGGTLLYLQATAGNKLNTGINQFVTLQSGIRSLYAGQSTYTGLTNTLMTDSNAAPSDMAVGSGDIRNAWGGDVTVAEFSAGNQFQITFERVPNNACVKLATLNPGGTGGSGLASVTVTGTELLPPISTASAVTECAGTADSNTILWTFN